MNADPRAFRESAHEALNDAGLKSALGRLKTHFALKRQEAAARYGDFEGLREAGRAIRDHSIANLDTLLETFERNVVARGGEVHWARDAAEARAIILQILRDAGAKTVTKGKSMVSEEIALNPFLEANGLIPIETDLGEYIIQLRKEPPSHIIAPAFHLHKEQVEETFREAHATLDPARNLNERQALVAEARTMLRASFEAADAGITGANFLSAAEGTAVIVTNEGNGDLTRLLPRTHIVLTGIEKVVADLDDVAVLLRLLTRSATGQEISSYVSLMSGPRERESSKARTAFHVVLLDNGRSKLLGTEAQDVLRCIRCAACLNHCPIYGAVGGHAYGATYPGPIGAALNPGMIGVAMAGHHANASTFCGRCAEVCPVKIPLPTIMRHWRAKEYADGLAPRAAVMGLGVWAFAAKRPALYRFAARLAARALKLLGGRGAVHALPLMNGWFAVRDLPTPQGRTFQDMWRNRSARGTACFASIRSQPRPNAPKPEPYRAPSIAAGLVSAFAARAEAVDTEIRILEREDEIPAAVAEILRAHNLAARIHLPPQSDIAGMNWRMDVEYTAPGPDDTTVTRAPLAIAETGTLIQPARDASPASWHFRPGFEITILRESDIVAHFEDALAILKKNKLPATINLITGPSRTGDIEQTLELGAHGPKALAVLIVRD